MIEHQAIYKCRLCGEEYASKVTTSIDTVIENFLHVTTGYKIKRFIGNPVTETEMHCCADGSHGMADFIGFKKVEKVEK